MNIKLILALAILDMNNMLDSSQCNSLGKKLSKHKIIKNKTTTLISTRKTSNIYNLDKHNHLPASSYPASGSASASESAKNSDISNHQSIDEEPSIPVKSSICSISEGLEYFNENELKYYKQKEEIEKLSNSEEVFNSNFLKLKKAEAVGEGGFSKVYKGFDEIQGKLIAIKELKCHDEANKNVSN